MRKRISFENILVALLSESCNLECPFVVVLMDLTKKQELLLRKVGRKAIYITSSRSGAVVTQSHLEDSSRVLIVTQALGVAQSTSSQAVVLSVR